MTFCRPMADSPDRKPLLVIIVMFALIKHCMKIIIPMTLTAANTEKTLNIALFLELVQPRATTDPHH